MLPRPTIRLAALATILSTFTLLAGCGAGSKNDNASPELSIPYERHVLDNGLTVIIHEDHSDPIAHVDLTYHVGSAREELGKSGFAHLFEHMMFQGSENVADEEHIKIVTEAGGTMNGTTNRDRTNYFETVPANHLETMLWLEADRMGFFLEGLTQEKFEVQRATVKNEKQQNYDNRAYGRAFELINKTLYPYGHPYSWLTIGDLEDLDRTTAEDLRNFFLRWYGPNNATLTIGGDVEPKQVLQLVKKYFGGIERGPEVKPLSIPGFELDNDRYVSYYDDKIRFPAVTLSFPTVPKFHPDAAALHCLADILGSGKGSYLYQNLVASRKAIQASASHNPDELAGEFFMFVLPYPGKSLEEFETELRATFDRFEENGVSDDDLQKFKANYEMAFVDGLEKVSGKVSQLAYYATFAESPSYFQQELENYLAVSKDDVMRVYRKYIKNKPSVVLSVLAEPEGKPARPDNFHVSQTLQYTYPKTDYSNLEYTKAEDNFDRSIKPKAQAAKLVSPPTFWKEQSANGIQIIGSESHELPKVSIELNLVGGYELDMLKPELLGLASLSASMLNTSTENYSEKEIAEELDKLGSYISVSSEQNRFTITLSALSKHLDATLKLLEEKLLRPAFNQNDFERLQEQSIENAKSSTKQASSIADIVFNRIIYGEQHPRGIPDTQLIHTLPNITVEATHKFYQEHFNPVGAELVIVGDINKTDILQKLEFLFQWQKPATQAITLPDSPNYSKTQLFFVDKADAAQSEIRIGYLTELAYDASGEFFKRSLMNFTLGGAFNSRINLNLREEKGLTYGARTGFDGSEEPGPFLASTSVKTEGTALAVSEIMREIALMRDKGINSDELNFLKQAVGQRDALKYEASFQKLGFLAHILRFNIDKDYVKTQNKIVESITSKDIHLLAQKHLRLENMAIIVVGDKAQVFEDLKALNYPIIELNEEGAPLEGTKAI